MRGEQSVFCGINFCAFDVMRRFCGIYFGGHETKTTFFNARKLPAFRKEILVPILFHGSVG